MTVSTLHVRVDVRNRCAAEDDDDSDRQEDDIAAPSWCPRCAQTSIAIIVDRETHTCTCPLCGSTFPPADREPRR